MIKRERFQYSVQFLCMVLEVSASGYYAWFNRKPSKRAQEDARLKLEIRAAHKRTRGTCGPERLQSDMADQIDFLGGKPSVNVGDILTSESNDEMLEQDLAGEEDAIKRYKIRIEQAEELKEFALAQQLRHILAMEQ